MQCITHKKPSRSHSALPPFLSLTSLLCIGHNPKPLDGQEGNGSGSKLGNDSSLARVDRLDLRLERLTSVQGLDEWCPNLKVSRNVSWLTDHLVLRLERLTSVQGLDE